jgi:hypothetical protein
MKLFLRVRMCNEVAKRLFFAPPPKKTILMFLKISRQLIIVLMRNVNRAIGFKFLLGNPFYIAV